MRLRTASWTAIVLVVVCLVVQLAESAMAMWMTIRRIDQGLDSIYLVLTILYVVTGLVEIITLLIILGVLSSTREQLLFAQSEDSPDGGLGYEPHDESRLRLRQAAGAALVLASISLAIVVVSHLLYIARLLPFLEQGLWGSYALCSLLSLIGSVLVCTAILTVFKSLARNTEQLMRDQPPESPPDDVIANGSCGRLRTAAMAAMLLVLVSVIMGLAVCGFDFWSTMNQGEGQIDTVYLLTMILGVIGGILLDVSLLMVLVSLFRIEEPLPADEPAV